MDKVKEFYDTDQLKDADPVPGSLNALNRLREMGYSLTIMTARSILHELDSTVIWVDKHYNGNLVRDSLGPRAHGTKEYSATSFSRRRKATALHTMEDVLARHLASYRSDVITTDFALTR